MNGSQYRPSGSVERQAPLLAGGGASLHLFLYILPTTVGGRLPRVSEDISLSNEGRVCSTCALVVFPSGIYGARAVSAFFTTHKAMNSWQTNHIDLVSKINRDCSMCIHLNAVEEESAILQSYSFSRFEVIDTRIY